MPRKEKAEATPRTRPTQPEAAAGELLGAPVAKVGNLTRDPQLRTSDSGVVYAVCGLAVDTPVVADDPETDAERVETETRFYDLVCFGTLAENVAASMAKGTRVLVAGRVEVRAWTDDDGATRVVDRIVADAIGPELRWATATVTKRRPSAPTAEE